MRVPRTAAALLAAALALPLAGCFGVPGAGDVAGQVEDLATKAEDLASQAQEVADALSNVDFSKTSRLVAKDAATGETLGEVTDQEEIERAVSFVSGANGLTGAPEGAAEYVFEIWQPETLKLGQDEGDADETKVLELTTYEGSQTVTLEVVPIGLELNLASQGDAADALRGLVE